MARSPARYLGPVALLVVVGAIVLVIRANGSGHASPAPPTARTAAHLQPHHPAPTAAARRFYIVQSGDTYSTIAAKTGVAISTLESLNPSVNPTALQTGERLRLR